MFESSNRFLDTLVCSEELGFQKLDGCVEFGEGNRVTLEKVFGTSGCVREFVLEFGYLDLESLYIERDGGGSLDQTIECVFVFGGGGGVVEVCLDGFELGVQAWDQLKEFMSIVISTDDISIEGFLEVGKADEKVVNGDGMFLLFFEHIREGVDSYDVIHGVLIGFHFSKLFFDLIVFPSVENGHVIGFVQEFITHGHSCH